MIIKIENLDLQPADRVVIPKSDFRIVQHHGIYLGINGNGTHLFAENDFEKGVRIVSASDFFNGICKISRIEKFLGNNLQRHSSLQRAIALQGKTYNLIEFNCEHYSNLVQHNVSESPQLQKGFFIGLLAIIFGGVYFAD